MEVNDNLYKNMYEALRDEQDRLLDETNKLINEFDEKSSPWYNPKKFFWTVFFGSAHLDKTQKLLYASEVLVNITFKGIYGKSSNS